MSVFFGSVIRFCRIWRMSVRMPLTHISFFFIGLFAASGYHCIKLGAVKPCYVIFRLVRLLRLHGEVLNKRKSFYTRPFGYSHPSLPRLDTTDRIRNPQAFLLFRSRIRRFRRLAISGSFFASRLESRMTDPLILCGLFKFFSVYIPSTVNETNFFGPVVWICRLCKLRFRTEGRLPLCDVFFYIFCCPSLARIRPAMNER